MTRYEFTYALLAPNDPEGWDTTYVTINVEANDDDEATMKADRAFQIKYKRRATEENSVGFERIK